MKVVKDSTEYEYDGSNVTNHTFSDDYSSSIVNNETDDLDAEDDGFYVDLEVTILKRANQTNNSISLSKDSLNLDKNLATFFDGIKNNNERISGI